MEGEGFWSCEGWLVIKVFGMEGVLSVAVGDLGGLGSY